MQKNLFEVFALTGSRDAKTSHHRMRPGHMEKLSLITFICVSIGSLPATPIKGILKTNVAAQAGNDDELLCNVPEHYDLVSLQSLRCGCVDCAILCHTVILAVGQGTKWKGIFCPLHFRKIILTSCRLNWNLTRKNYFKSSKKKSWMEILSEFSSKMMLRDRLWRD